jgi:transcriptional regulator GlxA family with amidase domain
LPGLCNGTFILAEAGLLEGRRRRRGRGRSHFIDGSIWTSAAATAGIDLALAIVEKDFRAEVARRIAQSLVVYTAAPVVSRSIQRSWRSPRNLSGFKTRSPMPSSI